MISDELWNKLKRVHSNIYLMGLVSFSIQLGATLVYVTADTFTGTFMTPMLLLIMRSFSESMSTSIKIIAGIISDYFRNRKLLLSISYGMLILLKFIFFLCVFLGNKTTNPQSLLYISYLYILTHIVDRIMNCTRDAPQTAIMLESIQESNKYYIANNDVNIANDNVIFSLAIRKIIASLGSILGGIAAYFILRYQLLSANQTYLLSIVPIIIGNVILFFGVRDLYNEQEQKNINTEENISEEPIITNIVEVNDNNIFNFIMQKVTLVLDNYIHIFTMIFCLLSAYTVYKYSTDKLSIFIVILLYNLLFMSHNSITTIIFRCLLLFSLINNYGILAIIAFIIGVYMSNTLIEFKDNFNMMQLLYINENMLYSLMFFAFSILLVQSSYNYIIFILYTVYIFIYNYFPLLTKLYINTCLLILAQLRILLITKNFIQYLLFTITSTLVVYHANGYLFIIPNSFIELFKFISLPNTSYLCLFCISVIFMNFSNILYGIILSLVLIICQKYLFNLNAYILNLINYKSITGNLNILTCSLQTIQTAKVIYQYPIATGVLLGLFSILLIFIFSIPFLSSYTKTIICCTMTVILFGILMYIYQNHLKEYFIKYHEYLYSFGITLTILFFLHIGRFNDTFFFNHGTKYIENITKVHIPLIFTYLYIVITASSLIFSYIKKHKTLVFILIAFSLICTNLGLLWTTMTGFIFTLTCLGFYSSGNEVLFISLIKDVIPNDKETNANGTFLGMYYLGMSISAILNAIISVQLTVNSNMMVKKIAYISPNLSIIFNKYPLLFRSLIFTILPLISILLWIIFKSNKNEVSN